MAELEWDQAPLLAELDSCTEEAQKRIQSDLHCADQLFELGGRIKPHHENLADWIKEQSDKLRDGNFGAKVHAKAARAIIENIMSNYDLLDDEVAALAGDARQDQKWVKNMRKHARRNKEKLGDEFEALMAIIDQVEANNNNRSQLESAFTTSLEGQQLPRLQVVFAKALERILNAGASIAESTATRWDTPAGMNLKWAAVLATGLWAAAQAGSHIQKSTGKSTFDHSIELAKDVGEITWTGVKKVAQATQSGDTESSNTPQ